ncbi:MAG: double zinc ribbon domain-containing protein [Candidatus Omnitrophota bacterium]
MFKQHIKALLNVLFPAVCFTCGKKIDQSVLCPACRDKIKPLAPPLCKGCAKEKTAKGTLCKDCRAKTIYHDRLISCFSYEEPIKTLVHLLKYQHHDYLIDFLSSLMVTYLLSIGFKDEGADFITAVPSHPVRLKEREYNQSLLLAENLSGALGIPLKSGIIFCKQNRPHQTKLTKTFRIKNVEDNFYVKDGMEGKNIILIDDIITTGSTVSQCAKALKEKEAGYITVLTLAKT